ncbi:hypothetical protein CEUSTIGMA_g6010.t1 [Chlamydomonas eustigma]|uniref:GST C-terminal domain-containing protein n=1 Tax=Chlamydomonas eustigma TaxID=1157962 RepID=A0A250X737_9CHLO|nr:hypothetical protein CEUSTIGMA_g6010.t1 [Chlamydomonas eustigma]|eukprot:GAX78570.1 hypothetical protein CEUSTIGMA_g6010.t1 [Chlamydomonas eustigma]
MLLQKRDYFAMNIPRLQHNTQRHITMCTRAKPQAGDKGFVSKGLGILEWSGKVVPQGLLVSGVKEGWRQAWKLMVQELAPQDTSGSYIRQSYSFTAKSSEIKNEAGRYHLYLGNACPWCHRVLLAYVLRGFNQGVVSFTQLGSDPTKARRGGWIFTQQDPDPVWGAQDLWEVYDLAFPGWQGRCTAPLLVDKTEGRIISNESKDIVGFLDGFKLHGLNQITFRPQELSAEIDSLCEKIYKNVNNGVYRSGFATSQAAYDSAQVSLYNTLDELEARLSQNRFLLGDRFTQADLWLFPTICRFDTIYSGIFRCSQKLIRTDYPNLNAWMKDVWQFKGPENCLQVSDTIDIEAACASYYTSLFPLNPSGIVPSGPRVKGLGLQLPAGRGENSIDSNCFKA